MPEWPELRVMQERIAEALVGKKVVAVRVGDPVVLRALKPGDALFFDSAALHGPEELTKLPMTYLSIIIYPRS